MINNIGNAKFVAVRILVDNVGVVTSAGRDPISCSTADGARCRKEEIMF